MIDWATPLNAILAATGTLGVLVLTYFVDRYLRRRRARDLLEEAVNTAVKMKLTDPTVPAHKVVEDASVLVRATVPEVVKILGLDPVEVQRVVAQRVSSRGVII